MAPFGKYGRGHKYGSGIKYGSSPQPFFYRVEVRTEAGALKEILDNDLLELSWDYERIGGCGPFGMRLGRPFDNYGALKGGYDLRVYMAKETGSGSELWYRGFIQGIEPVLGEPEEVAVFGEGYVALLDKLVVNASYTNQDAALIARSILDTYVVPETGITYTAATVPLSGFTVDQIDFFHPAAEALKTLAEMLGREWGVDEDLKFYMLDPTETAAHFFRPGGQVTEYRPMVDWTEAVNEVLIRGGLVGGSPAVFTVSRAGQNAKRQKLLENSAVTTQAVADKLGGAVLDAEGTLKRRSSLRLTSRRARLEAAGHPLKRVVIEPIEGRAKYGTGHKYGSGLKYQGQVKESIERVSYLVSDVGVEASLELGSSRPDARIQLARVERQLQQVAARG